MTDPATVPNLFEFIRDKVVIVTGSRRGIGLAIGKEFLAYGARVAFHGRSNADDPQVLRAIEQDVAVYVDAELTRAEDRERLFARVSDRLGIPDILVNNAGLQVFGPIMQRTDEDLARALQINLVAVTDCMRRAVALMSASHAGCIVNIGSVRAARPGAGAAFYSATKAALVAMTRAAAMEFGPLGIRVNAVSPGLVWRADLEETWPEGARTYREQAPLGRIGTPEDVANACLFLASPAAAWITGIDLVVDGGISLAR